MNNQRINRKKELIEYHLLIKFSNIMAIVLALIWAALIGWLGSKRNIGFAWAFIASLFLTPIIGLIITLCSKKIEPAEESVNGEDVKPIDEQTEAPQSVTSENTMESSSSINHPNDECITDLENNEERN